jgi:uncharacterized tellurite resistance protein B-like protein
MSHPQILAVAFVYHFVQRLVEADERLFRQEVAALIAWNGEMVAAGLMAADGTLSPDYDTYVRDAHTELRTLLPEADRRALIERLRPIILVDGASDPREESVLAEAAEALGL